MAENQSTGHGIKPTRAVLLALALIGIYYLLPQLGNYHQTMSVLRHSSWLWVIIGVIASGFTYWAAALTQYAAGNSIGEFSDILWLQFAGYFMNHFLPFNLGSFGMTEEYYSKLGQRRSQALAFAIIPVVFGILTTIAIVLIVSPVTLAELGRSLHGNPRTRLITLVAGLCILLAAIVFPLYKNRLKNVLGQVRSGLRSIRNIRQLTTVVVGSITITLFSALALYSSVQAVHARVALVAVIILYFTSSLVSTVAPTPGGLGATEAALVFGLSSAGLSLPQAVASTLIYRFVMFWLPLLPGAVALRQVRRQKLINTV